jgi:monoamine oxidase
MMAGVRATRLSLASLLLAGAALAAPPSTDHDVVIVGAGAAGLYAAYTLDGLGYDVLILEASDRHGGRVRSSTLGDVGIELGAEELYGSKNNFVFNDIKGLYGAGAQTQIFTESSSQDTLISMDGGASTCWDWWGTCSQDADIVDFWGYYSHVASHAGDATDELVSDDLANDHGIGPGHRAYHLYDGTFPGGEFGTSVTRLGLRSLARQEDLWPLSNAVYGLGPTGYLDALDALYFGAVLGKVLYESPVSVVDTSGTKPVAIDANGVHHYADAILVTVSVGVLQAELIDFVPDLPAAKVAAYETLGMGHGMKLFLRFDTTFWDGAKLFWVIAEGPTGMCWTPAKYQPGSTNDVMTCFSMGENAEALGALPDDAARLAQVLADLDAMFGGLASAHFVEGVVQDWTAEPWVRGSYSYPAPGSYPDTGPSARQVLAQPVGAALFFAGEATHDTAPSTVPGALQSGERAAGEMDAALGGPPSPNAPTASFAADPLAGPAPLSVDFSDLSSPAATSWSWDFGDGNGSSSQNPVHEYTLEGTYSVSLTATNPDGSHTRVHPELIVVPEPGVGLQRTVGAVALWGLARRRRQLAR